jgi:crotonobetainyl-CoA:carnitine CoA-transferase CaiB-like acyl-CoA transferase
VLELTANMAGPLTVRHLADLGADVVKVEFARKPATRAGHWPGGTKAKYHYNRSGYFNKFNRNKRDICLDVSLPEGRVAFLKLVEWADVLVENNSARVMPNLDLGYDTLRAVNPGLIMLSMSGFGATGPHRDYLAYGSNIELSCGLVSVTGYGPGEVSNTGSFYGDPVAANHGAVAVLAALAHRQRTGRGQFIDLSLTESAAACFAEAIMELTLGGAVPEPRGSRSIRDAPQGVYRCAGDDEWLTLTVQNEVEWRALCSVIGCAELVARLDLHTPGGRRVAHDEIDAAISSWTANQDKKHAARQLQSAGVPAAPVLANWELVTNPGLHERGAFVTIAHPEVGVLPYPGFVWRFSRTPARVRRPAPLFAEHNREVFSTILGLSDAEIAMLYALEVTADEPQYVA